MIESSEYINHNSVFVFLFSCQVVNLDLSQLHVFETERKVWMPCVTILAAGQNIFGNLFLQVMQSKTS